MYKLIVFLCLSSTTFGQVHLKGKCDLKMNDMVELTMLGDWYELKRINEKNSVQGNCVSLNFYFNDETGETKFITTSVSNKKKVSRNASIVEAQGQEKVAHIVYTDGIEYDMVIQRTDNLNYFIVHGCNQNNNSKSVYGQVYTRSIVVPEATKAIINAALKANTDFAKVTWREDSHSREACQADSAMNLQVSSFLLLFVGLVLAKDVWF